MKKVLIVTPNWPPISCPDMHRVRMSLPFFGEFGWEPLILKINPEEQEGIKDTELTKTVPAHIKTWQAGYIPKSWTSWFGLKNVGLRSFLHQGKLGSEIIKIEKPEVIFFSTTMFPVMLLGRYWHSKHGVPYILDFQDPWLSDYQGNRVRGSLYQSWKYKISQSIASILEPITLRQATHIVSVSPGYVDTLLKRYSWLKPEQLTVLPFGAPQTDFAYLKKCPVKQTHFNPGDGYQHWVYVGRGGSDMDFALRALFRALARERQQSPQKFSNLMLHFIGTDYAPIAQATIEPIAWEEGVGDMVREHPARIPYFEALQCLLDADALIVPGSDEPAYTASKIYPYILAEKPLLAIFHQRSSVVSVLESTKAGTVITFETGAEISVILEAIAEKWLNTLPPATPITDWVAFTPYTAREMTRRLCEIFDSKIHVRSADFSP